MPTSIGQGGDGAEANPGGRSTSIHHGRTGPTPAFDWRPVTPDPRFASNGNAGDHLSIRRYTDTSPEMHQPALPHNLICMHLGGAKEVRRWHEGHMDVHSVELGALTIMPANQTNRWRTRGPIDFAHLMLSPTLIDRVAREELGRDDTDFHLLDVVGFRDPYLESLFAALLGAVERRAGRLYADSLLVVLIVELLQRRSTLTGAARSESGAEAFAKGGLSPLKLRRVVDHMKHNLGADIALADLTALTGLSRAQFFRAFKQSLGVSPHRYLTELRLVASRELLAARDLDVAEIARAVGLHSPTKLNALFKRRFRVTPKAYRQAAG